MAKTQNNGVSSLLKEDFGIEDFVVGDYSKKAGANAFGLEDIALANQLGLLSSFKDYDTSSDTFSMEAYKLLGESDQIGVFASQGLENAVNNFSILANIKKEFGVEGFDPLAYGMEGFTDTIKKALSWLVAAFKKIIQSVSNFIRGVMNWVGGQIAKTQVGLVEKYKNERFDKNYGKKFKAFAPVANLDSVFGLFINPINDFNKSVESFVKEVSSEGYGIGSTSRSEMYKTGKIGAQALIKFNDKPIDEKTKPSEVAKNLVFASNTVFEYSPAEYLKKGDWKKVLSKEFLMKMNNFVKDGKFLIKSFQVCLKNISYLEKEFSKAQLDIAKDNRSANVDKKEASKAYKEEKKKIASSSKKFQAAMKTLTHQRNMGGKLTGILYGVYANMLKVRGYYATAVRSYIAAKGKPESKKDKKNKEREERINSY